MTDYRQESPSVSRNKQPIFDVLRTTLPANASVLEIASGTGEHAVFFSENLPTLQWQPSDISAEAIQSIDSWQMSKESQNVRPAVHLDVCSDTWPSETFDAIVCINMIHISPWSATEALFQKGARHLSDQGILFLYGPYRFENQPLAESNQRFEGWLKARDPSFGIRNFSDLVKLAEQTGLAHAKTVEMPANNHCLVFQKT